MTARAAIIGLLLLATAWLGAASSMQVVLEVTMVNPPTVPLVITTVLAGGRSIPDGSGDADQRPIAQGTGQPGRTITLRVDGVTAGTAVADLAGDWSVQVGMALPPGIHGLRADDLTSGLSSPVWTYIVQSRQDVSAGDGCGMGGLFGCLIALLALAGRIRPPRARTAR